MATVTIANAQSSPRQERFEAFVEARLVRTQLPLSALTRTQQANFGVPALVALNDRIDELISALPTTEDGFPTQEAFDLFTAVDGLASGNVFNFFFVFYGAQQVATIFNEPRLDEEAFSTPAEIRGSGLLRRGRGTTNRLRRPEFEPNDPVARAFDVSLLDGFDFAIEASDANAFFDVNIENFEDLIAEFGEAETRKFFIRAIERVLSVGDELVAINPDLIQD